MADPADVIEGLRKASVDLRSMGDAGVLAGLGAALDLWGSEGGPGDRAAASLAREQGASAEMIRFGFRRLVNAHRPEALRQWLSDARVEAARRIAERSRDGRAPDLRELAGPPVVAQVLAGNVAGLSVPAVLEALLARSAVLLKPASGDLHTANAFKAVLEAAAPELSTAVAVEEWRGGAREIEDRVFSGVDFVVAAGGEEMTRDLGSRLRTPHRLYGPRFSIGVVGMDWISAESSWWEEVVREIVLWDQRGCLSPLILFVAGDLKRFSGHLAEALELWETRWPARPLTPDEAVALRGFRAPYEMADGTRAGSLDPGSPAWTVVWDDDPTLDTGPPLRVVRVTRRLGVRDLGGLLGRRPGTVQGMGAAFLTEREVGWKRAAGWAEVPRVCSLTSIQDPPAGWRADGRSGLAELLAFHGGR